MDMIESFYLALLNNLSRDQRVELFNRFCRGCGKDDPHCQCENEE